MGTFKIFTDIARFPNNKGHPFAFLVLEHMCSPRCCQHNLLSIFYILVLGYIKKLYLVVQIYIIGWLDIFSGVLVICIFCPVISLFTYFSNFLIRWFFSLLIYAHFLISGKLILVFFMYYRYFLLISLRHTHTHSHKHTFTM